jgi:hypothetical protein
VAPQAWPGRERVERGELMSGRTQARRNSGQASSGRLRGGVASWGRPPSRSGLASAGADELLPGADHASSGRGVPADVGWRRSPADCTGRRRRRGGSGRVRGVAGRVRAEPGRSGGGGWPAGGGAGAAQGRWSPAVLGLIRGGWLGDWGRKCFLFIFIYLGFLIQRHVDPVHLSK